MTLSEEKSRRLKEVFGFTTFRPGQEALINQILDGQDTLGIMPTGAGKSICYQLPALLFSEVTLVISPLISLMKDQVNALLLAGVSAAYLNSSLTAAQYGQVLQRIRANAYKIIYIAPERLLTEDFLALVQDLPIAQITIDEAHCVSQWGQDFRQSYLKIPQFIRRLPKRPVITAFTATATRQVRDDIIQRLELKNPYLLTTGFDRPNLYFAVEKPANKLLAVESYVRKNVEQSGIIYCTTRKNVEEVCAHLSQKGYAVTRYHAGLSDQERQQNQEDFIYDRQKIMVATNAFGMGIDKSNVQYVLHYNMPKNMESYYQEAGRAGRDGQPAMCILFYSGHDVVINQFLIENAAEEVQEKERELLRLMTFYCHTKDCLREYMLRYFEEKTTNYCGNCANCQQNFMEQDITIEAQKILSCVKRAEERFGIKMIVDSLRGSKNQKIKKSGLDRLSTYGIMAEQKEDLIRDIIHFLVLEKYLMITNTEYPLLKLTPQSSEVLFGKKKLTMKLVKEEQSIVKKKEKNDLGDSRLLYHLKELRKKIAQEQKVPAYIVFNDATLLEMSVQMPQDEVALLEITGVGEAKRKKYGALFLEEIQKFSHEKHLEN